jgi:hypothetical protein
VLLTSLAVALAAYAFDREAATTPEQAVQCCNSMHCSSHGHHGPLAVATDDLKRKFGGIEGLPTTLLYDRQGMLRTKVVGFEYTDNFRVGLKTASVGLGIHERAAKGL